MSSLTKCLRGGRVSCLYVSLVFPGVSWCPCFASFLLDGLSDIVAVILDKTKWPPKQPSNVVGLPKGLIQVRHGQTSLRPFYITDIYRKVCRSDESPSRSVDFLATQNQTYC